MNKKNIVLTIVAVILATIIVGETYVFWGNEENRVIAKNDSIINAVSSDTTKSQVATSKPQIKPVKIENETKETKNVESNKNNNDLTWYEISSRNEVKSRINGTTWETTELDPCTGLWHKFVIYGDNVDEYSAKDTRNYDDPKKWALIVNWRIYGVYEPRKGLFCVALKGKEGSGIFEDTPYFISFKGNVVFFSEGNTHIFLKLVDKK